jgi:lysozyme
MIQQMSKEGLEALILREGFRTTAYLDSVGIATIGVGHVIRVGDYQTYKWDRNESIKTYKLTKKQVMELLDVDLCSREAAVFMTAGKKAIDQNIFDAMVSFVFNVGTGVLARPWCKAGLTAENRKQLSTGLMKYLKPPEITGRRKSEVAQLNKVAK